MLYGDKKMESEKYSSLKKICDTYIGITKIFMDK